MKIVSAKMRGALDAVVHGSVDSAMVRRRLPVGMQTFRELREDGCYYVDKTHYIRPLIDGAKHYFLSRPRRFGKSLFLDTLKELFEGSAELFEGLAIHDGWDWSAHSPVVRLDFSQGDFMAPGYLHRNAMAQLDGLGRRAGVACAYDTAPERFSHLLETLHERTGERVAVLVDEYDKPMLDALEDPELARANRNYLRGLYSTLKFADAHVRFSFITGVSKFSKVNLFSGLNNLTDITLDPRYSAICGYAEGDLDAVFAPELPGLDREAIREWYNGYGSALDQPQPEAAVQSTTLRPLAKAMSLPRQPWTQGSNQRQQQHCGERAAGLNELTVPRRRHALEEALGGALAALRSHEDGRNPMAIPSCSEGPCFRNGRLHFLRIGRVVGNEHDYPVLRLRSPIHAAGRHQCGQECLREVGVVGGAAASPHLDLHAVDESPKLRLVGGRSGDFARIEYEERCRPLSVAERNDPTPRLGVKLRRS